MCSVVGYVGKDNCKSHIIEGLTRLEYRGYDSSGFACIQQGENKIKFHKATGEVYNLQNKLKNDPIDGNIGIGHTRWATHGTVSVQNAHPQFDCHNKISIVHNGIIENCDKLKALLESQGHFFSSQTDTEIVAHFLESYIDQGYDLKSAAVATLSHLEGAFALLVIFKDQPDKILAVRNKVPLCLGISDDANFVASDFLAFAGNTDKVIFLPDETFVILEKNNYKIFNFHGEAVTVKIDTINMQAQSLTKHDFEHFMLKEIYDQKRSIRDTIAFLNGLGSKVWNHIGVSADYVKSLKTIRLIACGTSWHASKIGQFFFENIAKIKVEVGLASEFRYMQFFPLENSLSIAVSQSGETADTLEAIRLINSYNNEHTVALTNVASSTMVRECAGFLLMQAGQEIAVASTKAFSCQIVTLYWLAYKIALEKGLISDIEFAKASNDLIITAEILETAIESYKLEIIQELAPFYSNFKNFIFLGRHIGYPLAMEVALKLKEITYCFADSYPAGELKHGPIALIDKDLPIFLFSSLDPIIYSKLVSNAQEIKARSGHLVVVAFQGQCELIKLANYAFILPPVPSLLAPLAITGVMQFLVYQIAKELNRPIDKPRNLAKSVTVE